MWSSFRCGDIVKALVVSFILIETFYSYLSLIVYRTYHRYMNCYCSIFLVLPLKVGYVFWNGFTFRMPIELPDSDCVIQFVILDVFLWKLSLGDARAYHLSTAKNELGVVSAESAAGMNFFLHYTTEISFLEFLKLQPLSNYLKKSLMHWKSFMILSLVPQLYSVHSFLQHSQHSLSFLMVRLLGVSWGYGLTVVDSW